MPEPLRPDVPIADPEGRPTSVFSRLWQTVLRHPVFTLQVLQEPPKKGELTIQATSDTALTFNYRGSDGVVRSATVTLA